MFPVSSTQRIPENEQESSEFVEGHSAVNIGALLKQLLPVPVRITSEN